MSISNSFKRSAIANPKCPICRSPLEKWGEEINLINKIITEMFRCSNKKCTYVRNKFLSLNR